LKWSDKVFNLVPIPEEIASSIFIPLNEEEMSRLPPLWEKSECKPSQELLPRSPELVQKRHLRPTMEEILDSLKAKPERVRVASPSLQAERIGCITAESTPVTTRQ